MSRRTRTANVESEAVASLNRRIPGCFENSVAPMERSVSRVGKSGSTMLSFLANYEYDSHTVFLGAKTDMMFEYYVATHSGVLGNNGVKAPKREKLALIDRRISEAHLHASEFSGHSQLSDPRSFQCAFVIFRYIYSPATSWKRTSYSIVIAKLRC